MKRISRFLALLLALLLMLSAPCAFSEEMDAERTEVGTAEDYVGLLMAAETPYYPETVVFTNAGPFMPAVDVSGGRMLRAASMNNDVLGSEGVELNRSVSMNENGSYTVHIEAYTTGKVTTVVNTKPVDFVLVLDQSSSMKYDFKGNSTSNASNRRQYAMKQAVNNFITAVNEKYSTVSDHRMAIVTFGNSATLLQGWTRVDATGAGELRAKVTGLPASPSGATNAGAGMQQAESLMGSGYNYNGINTLRQKVVILFTDGVPSAKETEGNRFNVDTANEAIVSAKKLKNKGITIYSVGIFSGVNPDQLYGDCNGNVGDRWGKTKLFVVGDVSDVDIPAGNRFLNYVSNNFANAEEIGLESTDWWLLASHIGWEITKNATRSSSNYYITAKDSASLNQVFTKISNNIQMSDIDLGSNAVVKDVVSQYFDVPTAANDVRLYTAAAKEDGTFEDRVEISDVDMQVSIDGQTVSVTGFDFNANFISASPKDGDANYGKKLIIEYTIAPKDGFLGGNGVPTGDVEQSGVYDKDNKEIKALDDAVPVDVPVKPVEIAAQDKNVYLLGSLTAENLVENCTVTKNSAPIEDWQSEFVNITVAPAAGTNLANLTSDTSYTLTATVAPKKSEGSATAQSVSSSAAVKVYTPHLTFKDSAINLGESADYSKNLVGKAVWKHGIDEELSASTGIYGEAPLLNCSLTPQSAAFTQDTPVSLTVRIGDVDVTALVTFWREPCDYPDCDNHDEKTQVTADESGKRVNFVVHVKPFDLKISVTGCDSIDENQSFLFTVTDNKGLLLHVAVTGNKSVTVKGLSAGKIYTVTQNTGWSWRYEPDSVEQTIESEDVQNGQAEIKFNNRRSKDRWLDGNDGKTY